MTKAQSGLILIGVGFGMNVDGPCVGFTSDFQRIVTFQAQALSRYCVSAIRILVQVTETSAADESVVRLFSVDAGQNRSNMVAYAT